MVWTDTKVKVFRIIFEYRILRLTLHEYRVERLKTLNYADYTSFSDLFSVYLKTFDHLNVKLFTFVVIHVLNF